MGNFYGGREGRSFVITKEFQTITEMVENFSKGPSYNEVHFDEYVLINTINKNSPENGQLFRRGYDFDSTRTISSYQLGRDKEGKTFLKVDIPAGGAIYVGTIVGPAGKAPTFSLNLYEDLMKLTDIAILDNPAITDKLVTTEEMLSYLTTQFGTGDVPYDKDKKVVQSGYENEIIGHAQYVKLVKTDGANTLNYYFHYDKLLYVETPEASIGWYLLDTPPITGEDKYNITNGHMLPGVVYKKNEDGSLYYENKGDGRLHLVPESYQDSIDWAYVSLRNENNEDSTAYIGFKFGYSVFEIEAETVSPYENRSDILGGAEEFTNKFNNLNLIEKIDTSTSYIEEGEDGTIGAQVQEHPFYHKWKLNIPKGIKGESIKNVRVISATNEVMAFDVDNDGNLQYNEVNGKILVKDYEGKQDDIDNNREIIVYDYYCYDRVEEGEHHVIYLGDFNKIDNIAFAHDGTFTLDYSHDDTVVYRKLVHWIDNMQFDEDGTVTVTFNDLDWDNGQIAKGILKKPYLFHWITDMDFQEDGSIKVIFNNTDISQGDIQNGIIDLPQFINWLTRFEISESGDINIEFNNENLTDIHLPNYIRKIENITLQDTGNANDNSAANNQKIRVTYNTKADGVNQDTFEISNPINYVMRIERDDSTNHLLLLHSDPARRAQHSTTYDGIRGWQDLGGLGYIMIHPDDNSTALAAKQNALSVGGVWFVTEEV